MSEQIYALDLDYELAYHLAIPESIAYILNQKFNVQLIRDDLITKIYGWQLEHVREHGIPATASVLEDQFPDITFVEPETAIGDLLSRLRVRYVRNEGREVLKNLAEQTINEPAEVASSMAQAARQLMELTVERGEIYGTGDWDRLERSYHEQVLKGPGPSFGFKAIDEHFHAQSGLTFVIAPPKSMKSWFAVNCVIENATAGRFPYLYALELPALDTEWRLALMAAGIPPGKYLRKTLLPEDLKKLEQTFNTLDQMGVHRIEKTPVGERNAELLVRKAQDAGADLVIIDQLQYLENDKGLALGEGKTQDYWTVISKLRDLSDEIPIMILHQFNRNVMFADKMPEMQLAKGSASVEETATLALGLWASKDMRASKIVEVGTLASRHFEYKSWTLGINFNKGCELNMIGEVIE